MQVPLYSLKGEVLRQIEISDEVFGVPFNEALVHQAVLRQQANARQGTADTKTRSEVSGSGKKLFRQKHTGMARAGDRRAPLRRGGGIVFGPHPRSYRQDMPKKMRRQALRCVLSAKTSGDELKILEDIKLEQPKTKAVLEIFSQLGVVPSTLIVTEQPDTNVIKSARNIPGTDTTPANLLNIVDILSHKMILMTEASVRKVEQLWGKQPPKGEESATV